MYSTLQPSSKHLPGTQSTVVSENGFVPVNFTVKSKRPRTSKPKVKTGCRTCKIRRVKCDETKPSCQRCLKFNGECGGYEMGMARSASKIIMPKPLAPIVPKILPPIPPEAPVPTIVLDPRSSSFADDPEYRYFRFFHEKTTFRLAGYFDAALWNRLVLQACEHEPSIRHAVIAIGALDMALESAQGTEGQWSSELREEDRKAVSHHQFALQQYGKAIKRMRDTLSEPRQDMRTILIACLLCVCFETFHGNNNSAVNHAQSGLKLINGWLPQFVKQGSLPIDYIPGLRSPAPHMIEDELIQAFSRLDVVTLMFSDEQPVEIHPQLKPNMLEFCRLMPQTFLSVEEARMYWDLMWRQTLRYVADSYGWGSLLGLEDSDRMRPGELWDKSFQPVRQYNEERQEDYLNGFLQWASAFEPIFHDSKTLANPKDFAAVMCLAAQNKACHVAIAGGFYGSEMYFDAHLETYQEILRLCEAVISYVQKQESADRAIFSFDGPITGSIYIVTRICRERITRQKAISMLESTPRREGIWDSVIMAGVAKATMEIEERGLEGNFIPEHARIKPVKMTFNMQQHRGTLRYLREKPEPGLEHHLLEAEFTW